jgi:hypothetical protein
MFAPVPHLGDQDAVQSWAKMLFRTLPIDSTASSHVVVHTTPAAYKAQHQIGTEFFLQTAQNKSLNTNASDVDKMVSDIDNKLLPRLVPKYRLESLDLLGDHVYVFEYEGALSHYYTKKPPVIAVKSWHSEIAANFINNYCQDINK